MRIFEPLKECRSDGSYPHCRLTFASDADRRRFDGGRPFRGSPVEGHLALPYAMQRCNDYPQEIGLPVGDRLGIGLNMDPMALSRRALDVLLPHIGPAVQLIPLTFDEGEYAMVNIVNVIDALDEAHSGIERFPSSGRVSRIKRYSFHPDVVRNEWIFKIRQAQAEAFVTEQFVDLVRSSGLTGFEFRTLWSDEVSIVA